jgi:hypothetical protein
MSEKFLYYLKPFATWFIANIFGFVGLGVALLFAPSLQTKFGPVVSILILTIPVSFAQWVALRIMQPVSMLWNLTIPLGLSVMVFRWKSREIPEGSGESIGSMVALYLLVGLIIGVLQWGLLRQQASGSFLWVVASSIGVAAGLWLVLELFPVGEILP